MSLPRRLLLALAGLMGAAGVALAAAGAHLGGDKLSTAALFLLIHASAVAGLAGGQTPRRGLLLAAGLLALGAFLFSGDIAARAFWGARLFPMAAPAGGMILIAGWLGLALAALFAPPAPPPRHDA
jgi:uncharacterized membrane protein YgdD (TMEM256/DUF423 family)